MRPLCTKPWTRFYVTAEGRCYNCCYQIQPFYQMLESNTESFEKIWNNKKIQTIREKLLNGRMPEACDCLTKYGSIPPEDADPSVPLSDVSYIPTKDSHKPTVSEIPPPLSETPSDDILQQTPNSKKQRVLALVTFGQVGAEPLYWLLMLHENFYGKGGEYRPLAHNNPNLEIPDGKIYVEKIWERSMIGDAEKAGAIILTVERRNDFNHFVNYKQVFNKTVYDFIDVKQSRFKKEPSIYLEDALDDPQKVLNHICDLCKVPHKKVNLSKWKIQDKFKNKKLYHQLDDEEYYAILQLQGRTIPVKPAATPPKFIATVHPYGEHSPHSLLYVIEWPRIVRIIKLPYPKASGMAWMGNQLIVACYNHLVFLNNNLKEVNSVTNNLFTDLHGVQIYGGKIFVASTTLDSIIVVNHEGKLANFYTMENHPDFSGEAPKPELDYTKLGKGDSPYYKFHINDVYVYGNRMYMSSLKKGKLEFNFMTQKIRQISPVGGHDLKLYGNCLYSTHTNGRIVSTELNEHKELSFLPSGLEAGYWHRGLLKFGSSFLMAGSDMPNTQKKPCIHWIFNGTVKETMFLPRAWACNSVHELEWHS